MSHKFNRKKAEEVDLEFYRRTKTIPMAWQVFGKLRTTNDWLPVVQQRKFREDAEKDLKQSKWNIPLKPIYKEYKMLLVPASKTEMSERKLLKGLEKRKTLRGAIESPIGFLAEQKYWGRIPFLGV
jgi:predicted ABC-class ATPase